jgi:alkylation response protein AidB-like acyl-CoA dehydrogenase
MLLRPAENRMVLPDESFGGGDRALSTVASIQNSLAKNCRDVRVCQIYEGTLDIQRMVIARTSVSAG